MTTNNQQDYMNENYFTQNRWSSYYLIINEIIKLKPKSILEIGPGNLLVSDILKRMNIDLKTLDFDENIKPDYLCDISKFDNFPDLKFDCIIASQVFEHIEYEYYIKALQNLKKNTDCLIISLPYTSEHSIFLYLKLYLPLIKQLKCSIKLYYKKIKHQYNGKHFWEIGKKFYSLRKIKKDIKNTGWKIAKSYINPENPYHYFFILK
jgi:hypothetical protein